MTNVSNGQTASTPAPPAKAKHPAIKVIRDCRSLHDLPRPTKTASTIESPKSTKTIRRRDTVPNLRPKKQAELVDHPDSLSSKSAAKRPRQPNILSTRASDKKSKVALPKRTSQGSAKPPSDLSEAIESIKQALWKGQKPTGCDSLVDSAGAGTNVLGMKPKTNKQGLTDVFKLFSNYGDVQDTNASPSSAADPVGKLHTRRVLSQRSSEAICPSLREVNASTSKPAGQHIVPKPISQEGKWSANVTIHGIDMDIHNSADFTKPIIRYCPSGVYGADFTPAADMDSPRTIQRSEVVTRWLGITQLRAEELFRIHKAFSESVKLMLMTQLQLIRSELQGIEDIEYVTDSGLFTAFTDRHLSFCRQQVTDTIAHKLYDTEPQSNITLLPSGLLALYLATTDCFFDYMRPDDPRDTSITLRIYFNKAKRLQDTFIRAAFTPDMVFFKDLKAHVQEGQSLVIVPYYQCNSVFRRADSPRQVVYKTNLPWLVWNEDTGGFEGLVPCSSATGPGNQSAHSGNNGQHPTVHSLEITVTATMSESLDDSSGMPIWFERSVNTRLLLTVATPKTENDEAYQLSLPSDVGFTFPPALMRSSNPVDFENRVNEVLKILSPSALAAAYESLIEMSWSQTISEKTKETSPHNEPPHQIYAVVHLARKHASLAARLLTLARQHADAEQHCLEIANPLGRHARASEDASTMKLPTASDIAQTDPSKTEPYLEGPLREQPPEEGHSNKRSGPSEERRLTQFGLLSDADTRLPPFRSFSPNGTSEHDHSPGEPPTKTPSPASWNPCVKSSHLGQGSRTLLQAEKKGNGTADFLQSEAHRCGQNRSLDGSLITPCRRQHLRPGAEGEAPQGDAYCGYQEERSKRISATSNLLPTTPVSHSHTDTGVCESDSANFSLNRAALARSDLPTTPSNLENRSRLLRGPPWSDLAEQTVRRLESGAATWSKTAQPYVQARRTPLMKNQRTMSGSSISSTWEKATAPATYSKNAKEKGEALFKFSNRFAPLTECAEGLTSSSETNDDNDVTVMTKNKRALWDLSSFRLNCAGLLSPRLCKSSWRSQQSSSGSSCAGSAADDNDERCATVVASQDIITPPEFENEAMACDRLQPSRLGSDEDYPDVSSNPPLKACLGTKVEPVSARDSPGARTMVKRSHGCRTMESLCPHCHRSNSKNLSELINHRRIQHNRHFENDDAPLVVCGKGRDDYEGSELFQHGGCSRKNAGSNCPRAPDGSYLSFIAKTFPANVIESQSNWSIDDAEKRVLGDDEDEQGLLKDKMVRVHQSFLEHSVPRPQQIETKLSKDEERDLEEAKKRSLQEQTAKKLAALGVSDNIDDVFDASITSDSEEPWCASDEDLLAG